MKTLDTVNLFLSLPWYKQIGVCRIVEVLPDNWREYNDEALWTEVFRRVVREEKLTVLKAAVLAAKEGEK